MLLSSLQKYILLQCYFNKDKKYSKKDLSKFYDNQKSKPKEIQKIITKSVERLVKKELLVSYGEHTSHKWYVRDIKLTSKGKKLAKELRGKQQQLSFN